MKAQEQILINWIDEHTDDLIQTAKARFIVPWQWVKLLQSKFATQIFC